MAGEIHLITACSSEIEKLAVSDQEYADYAASFDEAAKAGKF